MDIFIELVELTNALHQARVEHALCGGLAMAVHGHVRYTRDIDLLVSPEDLPQVLAVAKRQGFEFETTPMKFAAGTPNEMTIHRVNKVVGRDFLTLDLVVVSPILEDVWKGRNLYSWEGQSIQAVSIDGLAKMKRLANRDQDRVDLKKLGFDDEQPAPQAPDMSSEAVYRRLREVGQLYRLWNSLKTAKLIGPVDEQAPVNDDSPANGCLQRTSSGEKDDDSVHV